jgi:hypothetical protein
MPIAALFLTVALCVVAFSDAAIAQGAATGGTRDSSSPTMVFPIRPRDEPAPSTAVPNVAQPPAPIVRLRRNYHPYRVQKGM